LPDNPWDLIDSVRLLLYGQSGTGKTTCWSSFPDPVLALVCSGGRKPGELRSINTPDNRRRITPKIVTTTDHLKGLLEEEALGYATVVLDHVSGLEDLVLKQLLGLDELPAQRSWGLASQQQYGQCTLQCKEYLRAMLNLPGNVVVVGQERVFKGKDDGTADDVIRPTVGVGVMPSLAAWLMPACDYVVQAFKRQRTSSESRVVNGREVTTERRERGIDYCLRTGPHDTYCTKFRVPKGRELPEYVTLGPDDSAYAVIMSLIQGEP
jgi:hypothetical protein